MKNSPLFIVAFVAPIALIATVNYVADPQCIFHCSTEQIEANDYRPPGRRHKRVELVTLIPSVQPKTILLGTSRTNELIPSTTRWKYLPVLNIGLAGAFIGEMRAYLEHAIATSPIRQALLEIDPSNFGAFHNVDFNPNRLLKVSAKTNYFKYYYTHALDFYYELFSIQTFEDSMRKFLGNKFSKSYDALQKQLSLYAVTTKRQSDMIKDTTDPLDEFQHILSISHEYNIQLIIYIPPLHASQYEKRDWNKFEQWQRDIVSSLRRDSKETRDEITLWDFSGFNSITTVPLQSSLFSTTFRDISHASKATNKMVLDRMLNNCTDPCSIPTDFGIRLTGDNIENILQKKRKDRQRYIENQNHPQ